MFLPLLRPSPPPRPATLLLGLLWSMLLAVASLSGEDKEMPGWELSQHHGLDYVSCDSIHRFYRFSKLNISKSEVFFESPVLLMRAYPGRQELEINHVRFMMSFPLAEIQGRPWISKLDLIKLIDPVLRPSYITQNRSIKTVVVDITMMGAPSPGRGTQGLPALLAACLRKELEGRDLKLVCLFEENLEAIATVRARHANGLADALFIGFRLDPNIEKGPASCRTSVLAPRGAAGAGQAPSPADGIEAAGNAFDASNIALGTALHASMVHFAKLRDNSISRSRTEILRHLTQPAVMLDLGWHDQNPEQTELLCRQWAATLSKGIANFQRSLSKLPLVRLAGVGPDGTLSVAAEAATLNLRYKISVPGDARAERVRVLVDGSPVDIKAPLPDHPSKEASIVLPLPPKSCVITLFAENAHGSGEPAVLKVLREAPPSLVNGQETMVKPTLYILAAGIADYQNNQDLPDLQYSAKDATDFVAAFQRQEGGLYGKVTARLLTDGGATAGDILDGLDWLKKESTSKDVTVIFLSGHGENDEELRYYFCPHDYARARRLRTGVSFEEIQNVLQSLPGKVIFFIDSCHAGNALGKMVAAKGTAAHDLEKSIRELSEAESGAVIFASSTGRQISIESADWQNGAFTKAIVEGLDGRADLFNNGKITVSTLEAYIAERVKELSEGSQSPTVAKPQTVPDFPIAVRR